MCGQHVISMTEVFIGLFTPNFFGGDSADGRLFE